MYKICCEKKNFIAYLTYFPHFSSTRDRIAIASSNKQIQVILFYILRVWHISLEVSD